MLGEVLLRCDRWQGFMFEISCGLITKLDLVSFSGAGANGVQGMFIKVLCLQIVDRPVLFVEIAFL